MANEVTLKKSVMFSPTANMKLVDRAVYHDV